jgi:hypothetical protein
MRPSIHSLKPMLSTLAPLPSGEKWSFEPKWDGFRGMCFVTDGSVRLISRLGNDLTRLCPGVLIQANSHIGPAVLDGEIVAFRDGQQSFEALQGVLRRQGAVDDVAFLVFDLLWLKGESLLAVPYAERREQLESLAFEPPVSVSPRFEDGEALFEETLRPGYEGVVAKRRKSTYRPGIRTRDLTVSSPPPRNSSGSEGPMFAPGLLIDCEEDRATRALVVTMLLGGDTSPLSLRSTSNITSRSCRPSQALQATGLIVGRSNATSGRGGGNRWAPWTLSMERPRIPNP